MGAIAVARIAKLVALLGFVLPWVTVSCSDQKLISLTGLNLATGSYALRNPVSGALEHHQSSPSILLWIAVLAIVCGALFSFGQSRREAAVPIIIGSLLAMLMAGVTVMSATSAKSRERAASRSGQELDAAMAGLIRVELSSGFWLTMGALAAAAGSGAVAASAEGPALAQLLERVPHVPPPSSTETSAASPSKRREDDEERDLAFWDGISDKNDPDLLQEYLIRFPHGRFAVLARAKLERMGIEPLVAVPPEDPTTTPAMTPLSLGDASPPADAAREAEAEADEPAQQTAQVCPSCGFELADDDQFCSECGAPVGAAHVLASGAAGIVVP